MSNEPTDYETYLTSMFDAHESQNNTNTNIYDNENQLHYGKFTYTELQNKVAEISEYAPPIALQILQNPHQDKTDELYKQKQRILSFPWKNINKPLNFNLNLNKTMTHINNKLYGMNNAKTLIYLWISSIIHNSESPCTPILLHGKPGTGKTTFAKILADSLNVKLEFISIPSCTAGWQLLGETGYKNSDVGRIVKGIIQHQSMPIFLFDEIDKDGNGSQYANASSALLNILDNTRTNFTDGFLGIEIDLTKTIFILTCNNLENVSEPLINRCRLIEIIGHFNNERKILLEKYIIPSIRNKFKLSTKQFTFNNDIIELILNSSNEKSGGVRLLEQITEIVVQAAISKLINFNIKSTSLTVDEVKPFINLLNQNNENKNINPIGFITK